jgi:hypothetical protein
MNYTHDTNEFYLITYIIIYSLLDKCSILNNLFYFPWYINIFNTIKDNFKIKMDASNNSSDNIVLL